MKKTWLFRAIALSLLLCLILTACASKGNGDEETTVDSGTDTTTEEVTTDDGKPTKDPSVKGSLTIDGIGIENFRIVYAQSTVDALPELLRNWIVTGSADGSKTDYPYEYDFDRISAERLRDLIAAVSGWKIPVVSDKEAEVPNEILVGKTNRSKTQTFSIKGQDADEFTLKVNDRDTDSKANVKLVVCGGGFGATWHAIDVLDELFETRGEDYELANTFDESGTCELTSIACLGDSLTRGSHSIDDHVVEAIKGFDTETLYRNYLSYPAMLGRILWKDYIVTNYGQGGTTALPSDNYYAQSAPFKKALTEGKEHPFDYVFLMIGTNDASRAQNDEGVANYKKEVEDLVLQVLIASPNAKVILMNCPIRYETGTSGYMKHMREVQKELADELATRYNIAFYDMYTFTHENFNEEWFNKNNPYNLNDYTHPNEEGYQLMGITVANAVKALEGGAEDPLLTLYNSQIPGSWGTDQPAVDDQDWTIIAN